MSAPDRIERAAQALDAAEREGRPIAPIASPGDDLSFAYDVQAANVARWLRAGRRAVGRKVGLTSSAARAQLGIADPVFGVVFADRRAPSGGGLAFERMIAPMVELEIALELSGPLERPLGSIAEAAAVVAAARPAIEIVDPRIQAARISAIDLIADDVAACRHVLGEEARSLDGIEPRALGAVLKRGELVVARGSGADALGDPLEALRRLSRHLYERGERLIEGDIVLTGALGPAVEARKSDVFVGEIEGFAPISIHFH